MDYQITLPKDWPYRHPAKGRSVLSAGTYNVPEEVLACVAERAVAEGVAVRSDPPRPVTVSNDVSAAPMESTAAPQKRCKRGPKKSKGQSPLNKALGPAPENKAGLFQA